MIIIIFIMLTVLSGILTADGGDYVAGCGLKDKIYVYNSTGVYALSIIRKLI